MAAPTFLGQGAIASGVGAGSVAWPAGHQADDIGVLMVETANESVATPSGWTLLGNTGTGTAGAAGSVAIWVFWKRATSAAEANASFADPGDHFRGRMMAFRGCETSGSPFEGSVITAIVATAQTAVSIGMPTTTVADCFAVAIVANATSTTANQTTTTTWANADLPDIARISNGNVTSGVGGGMDAAGGTKAVAGAISNTTATLQTASAQATLSFALKPPSVAPPTTPTEGGIFVATGVKAAIGATGATTATLDTAAVQARVVIALKPEVSAPANNAPIFEAVQPIQAAVLNEVTFPITVTDIDGDAITLSLVDGATSVPTGAVLVEDELSGNFNFLWTPTTQQAGEWTFFIRATDDGVPAMSTDMPVSIVVQAGPTRPPFGAGVGGLTSIT